MATLPETATWEAGIYQLETTDPVQGGLNGIDNLQGKQLANRTVYLKQQADAANTGLSNHISAADPHPQYTTAAELETRIAALVASAPAALDTLNELATALGDDPNFATTITNALATKAPLASPALTGTPTAPTAAAGKSTTQLATTAFVVGEKGGRRNYLINGNFDKWDYATSQTKSGYGSDNRWSNYDNYSSGSTKTVSQQVCGDTERALFNAAYFSRTVVNSSASASNACLKSQSLENITLLAGKTVTLSFWARADANRNIAIEFNQWFGSGGSPSSGVTGIGSQLVALTTSWQKKTITITLPSIVGKTLGTDGVQTTSAFVVFWFDAGSNFAARSASLGSQSGTFDIAQVKIEDGSVATNGWHPYDGEFGGEAEACARYYETGNGVVLCGTGSGNYQGAVSITAFKSLKRVIPTVVTTQTSGSISAVSPNGIFTDCMYVNPTSQASDGQCASYTWTASAEL